MKSSRAGSARYSSNRSVVRFAAMKDAFASSVVCGGQARGKVAAATTASAAESAALARLTCVLRLNPEGT